MWVVTVFCMSIQGAAARLELNLCGEESDRRQPPEVSDRGTIVSINQGVQVKDEHTKLGRVT